MSKPAGGFPPGDWQEGYWDEWHRTGQYARDPARPWFTKKRFVLPGLAVLLIALGSAFSASAGTGPVSLVPGSAATAPAVVGDQEANEANEGNEANEAHEGTEANEAQKAPAANEAHEGTEANEANEGTEANEANEGTEANEGAETH